MQNTLTLYLFENAKDERWRFIQENMAQHFLSSLNTVSLASLLFETILYVYCLLFMLVVGVMKVHQCDPTQHGNTYNNNNNNSDQHKSKCCGIAKTGQT